MFIVGKIKLYLITALAVLLPILYVLGRKDGKKIEKQKVLADELQAQTKASDFYKAMAEHEEDTSVSSRDGLITRLRRDGL
jgi:hypothetical protein|tara:strand:- start:1133 stop:1375 length:243 start_codon:yes stop_codon:yes gene_type:complete